LKSLKIANGEPPARDWGKENRSGPDPLGALARGVDGPCPLRSLGPPANVLRHKNSFTRFAIRRASVAGLTVSFSAGGGI
jgi:hypothetical protein